MSKIFPRPELYWEGSVENQALRAPGQEAFPWFSSLCALKATSVPFLPLFQLKNIYEHLFHSKELKRTCTISKKVLITNITIIIFFAITAKLQILSLSLEKKKTARCIKMWARFARFCPQPHAVKPTQKRLNGQTWYKYPQQRDWEFATLIFYGVSVRLSGQFHPTRWCFGSHCITKAAHVVHPL